MSVDTNSRVNSTADSTRASVDNNSRVVFPRVFHLKIIIQQVTIVVNRVIRFYSVCFIENSVLRDVTNASSQQTAATKQDQQTGSRS